ncbi:MULTISPECIES: A24 family peptidase [unclassified Actinotalea]|uniref:prepilin peptidase n=1 Tax=unclassified Actinotalea TaxID=2638618 RepID=UPI0015F3F161|nr:MULTISPECIES: A24 family peptidase [unclassified Actinotalea]
MPAAGPASLQAIALVCAGVLGLLVGSFLNVVVWRVPRGDSVVRPPSACPTCGAQIRRRDNVPVLSWLLLRGRCRDCGAPISARYPLVELATALLFVLVVVRFGSALPGAAALPAYLYLAAIAVALALIDVDVHRLPDAIVLPAYPVVAVLLSIATWATGDWGALGRAALGGLALLLLYGILFVAHPGGMGLGDVKLAGVLGLALGWLGWGALAVGAFAAFLVGGAFAVALLLAGRAGRRSGIPFGPWMLVGAAIGIGWGEALWAAYLELLL